MSLTPEALRYALQRRNITQTQLDQALTALSHPDPPGIAPVPTREDVAHVAAYLHVRRGRTWIQNPS
jgi:hypothetical protein